MGKFLLMGKFIDVQVLANGHVLADGSGPRPWGRHPLQVAPGPGAGPGAMSKNVPIGKNLPIHELAH